MLAPRDGEFPEKLTSQKLIATVCGQKLDFILSLSTTKVAGQSMATFFPGVKERAMVPYPGLFT